MARQKRQYCPETNALSEKLGQTILRLRTADKLSLGDLSEMSGVAKSMISQIEKNETNPSLATLSRLSLALKTSVEAMVSADESQDVLIEKLFVQDIPLLKSEDGLCELRIIGSVDTLQWVQWYDFRAEPGGILKSSPHPAGSVENLSILAGEVTVEVGSKSWTAKAGETIRYRGDFEHSLTNTGDKPAHATMVNILAHMVRTQAL
ncbi:helix-turn-helix domain-containing protein [Litorimonas haliclonae]|uniref:helix-turn-helix domain-containing protein n=1 Tax=Litorimonas haliclonae TaxID=2081977 RepID=UPI0039F10FC8